MPSFLTIFRNIGFIALSAGLMLCLGLYLRLDYVQEKLAEQEDQLILLHAVNASQKQSIERYLKEQQENERRMSIFFKEKEKQVKKSQLMRNKLYQNNEDWNKQKMPQSVLELFQR